MKLKAKWSRYAHYYCILPGGNAEEFPELDAELKRRGIKATFTPIRGGRIYRIDRNYVPKLPVDRWKRGDDKGTNDPYLGDDHSGHSIYYIPKAGLAQLLRVKPHGEPIVWENL
jgi:hypothetical protein